MKDRIFDLVMPLLPKNDLSHFVGRLAHRPLPGVVGRKAVEIFARAYRINMDEAELPIEQYRSIGELFTRRLRPGVRPIGAGIVHPADSRITECGKIEAGRLLQAKGSSYGLAEFIQNDEWAGALEGGSFVTYYLCPTDYHRVHSPLDAQITWCAHVPGEMWPVNGWSVARIRNLFAINERVVIGLQTPQGRAVLVMVAATNVGNMTMSFEPGVRTNLRRSKGSPVAAMAAVGRGGGARSDSRFEYRPPKSVRKGDELGVFHMGSTVVMLYENSLLLPEKLAGLSGRQVNFGAALSDA